MAVKTRPRLALQNARPSAPGADACPARSMRRTSGASRIAAICPARSADARATRRSRSTPSARAFASRSCTCSWSRGGGGGGGKRRGGRRGRSGVFAQGVPVVLSRGQGQAPVPERRSRVHSTRDQSRASRSYRRRSGGQNRARRRELVDHAAGSATGRWRSRCTIATSTRPACRLCPRARSGADGGHRADDRGRHILLVNFPAASAEVGCFEDVAALKAAHPQGLVVVPHAFYPTPSALGPLMNATPRSSTRWK